MQHVLCIYRNARITYYLKRDLLKAPYIYIYIGPLVETKSFSLVGYLPFDFPFVVKANDRNLLRRRKIVGGRAHPIWYWAETDEKKENRQGTSLKWRSHRRGLRTLRTSKKVCGRDLSGKPSNHFLFILPPRKPVRRPDYETGPSNGQTGSVSRYTVYH